jgi:hypothetical protein
MCRLYHFLIVGKTTLLKLLGGQMFSGQFTGNRAINSAIPPRKAYDEVLYLFPSNVEGFSTLEGEQQSN